MKTVEEWNSLLQLTGQIPLVIAFVYFALKIIAYYLEDQKASREATSKMINQIINDWQASQKERNEEMKSFLRSLQDQEKSNMETITGRMNEITMRYEKTLEVITSRNEKCSDSLSEAVLELTKEINEINSRK